MHKYRFSFMCFWCGISTCFCVGNFKFKRYRSFYRVKGVCRFEKVFLTIFLRFTSRNSSLRKKFLRVHFRVHLSTFRKKFFHPLLAGSLHFENSFFIKFFELHFWIHSAKKFFVNFGTHFGNVFLLLILIFTSGFTSLPVSIRDRVLICRSITLKTTNLNIWPYWPCNHILEEAGIM